MKKIGDMKIKNPVLKIGVCASFLAGILFCAVSKHYACALPEQRAAEKWSKKRDVAQVSCFFSVDSDTNQDVIQEFEHSIDDYLRESSMEPDAEHPGARLWIDAYSAEGKITLKSDRGSVDLAATGIGGDFFWFHPPRLLYGACFSGNDVNKDYCMIDEDAAWQLFGSGNVAGQYVTISGAPHIITGVIQRPKGRMIEEAGLNASRVYVSYESLSAYGEDYGINHYEIIMPNPVSRFAYKYVKEKLGKEEKSVEILENSSRFALLNRWKLIGKFWARSMNGKAILYPYWENLARGYEDLSAVFLLLAAFFLIFPFTYALVRGIRYFKQKRWTIKSVCLKMIDMWSCFVGSIKRRKER